LSYCDITVTLRIAKLYIHFTGFWPHFFYFSPQFLS
jgi:hypothetical protein